MSRKYGWGASAFVLCGLGGRLPSGGGDFRGDPDGGRRLLCVGRMYRTAAAIRSGAAPNTASPSRGRRASSTRGSCPKPVCNPCDIEGYGYYPTCWRPWAYPPNYEHCPVPPPGVLASQPPPLVAGPGFSPDDPLPAPQKAANPHPNR